MKKVLFILFMICAAHVFPSEADSIGKYLNIKLVTIGPSDELNSWWGHTAIIVENNLTGTSKFYNYGIFSMEEEGFYTNFAQGRLIFRVEDWDTRSSLLYYKKQNRDIIIQTLNIPDIIKYVFNEFLKDNVLPGNNKYKYDHYRDNCSTRVRDLIDRAVDNQFKAVTNKKTDMTLRDHTKRHTEHHFWMNWLLMFLMNDTIDNPITQWEEMFLPAGLEKYADSLQYRNDNGELEKLVMEKEIYYKAQNFRTIPEKPHNNVYLSLFLGIICAAIISGNAFFFDNRTIQGISLILFGLIFGIIGTALFYMSMFTDHIVTYDNENLFLANPLTLFLLPLGILYLFKYKFVIKLLDIVLIALMFFALISIVIKFLPGYEQENGLIIALILPYLSALYAAHLKMSNFPLE